MRVPPAQDTLREWSAAREAVVNDHGEVCHDDEGLARLLAAGDALAREQTSTPDAAQALRTAEKLLTPYLVSGKFPPGKVVRAALAALRTSSVDAEDRNGARTFDPFEMRAERRRATSTPDAACDCHLHERQVCDVCQGVGASSVDAEQANGYSDDPLAHPDDDASYL
jgi:hypothetical protein